MDGKRVRRMVEALRVRRPRGREELAAYVRAFLGLRVPGRRVCEGHDSPMDYLAYAVLGEETPLRLAAERCQQALPAPLRREDGMGYDAPVGRCIEGDNRVRATLQNQAGDCVVLAKRGGGKTQLGAAASLLECMFLPGCQVRILGGSEQQSQRMYEYLGERLERG